jgi:hypothetical protein
MQRKPRVVSPQAMALAKLLDEAVRKACGPDSTFAQRQDMARAIAGEVLAEFAARGTGAAVEPDGEA